MDASHLKRPLGLRGLAVLALALSLYALQAKAAMLFDDVRVTSTRFDMPDGSLVTGIELSLTGLRLPGDPAAPARTLRTLAFEVVKTGTNAEDVAIALSASGTGMSQLTNSANSEASRLLITAKDATDGGLATKIKKLHPQGRAVLATICTTMADPANVSAVLDQLAQADRPAPQGLFQSAVLSLATKCRFDLAKAGVISGGFISRDKLPARLLHSADGALSAESIAINNWMGNPTDRRMTGSIVTLRAVEVTELDLRKAPKTFAATSLLWDGHIDVPSRRRIALFGRVSQYPGAESGLFDAADDLSINLYPTTQPTKGLDKAIAESSRESLVLVQHVLSNLPLLQAAALETTSLTDIDITGALPVEAAAYWSVVRFGDDASAVLDMVEADLFRRAYPDEKSVLALQESLTKWRLYDGAVDGKTGPNTRSAFAAFERMVSGAANGTPSDVEIAALPLWSDSPPQIPPALTGSLADALTPETSDVGTAEAMASLRDLEIEANAIQSEIAALEAEIAEVETEKTSKINNLEILLTDCYCQGGRLCP
jgi:hypothetical protein